jgi:hypothetical protein
MPIRRFVPILASCCLLAVSVAGCDLTSAERIAYLERAVVAAQEKVAAAETQISDIEGQLRTARTSWDNPELPSGDRQLVQGTMDQLSSALATAQQVRRIAAATLTETQTVLEKARANPGPGAELDIAAAIVQAVTSRLGPQAAAWGTIGVMVLSILGNVLQRRQIRTASGQVDEAKGEAASIGKDLEFNCQVLANHRETLGTIVHAIEKLPPEAQAQVKPAIMKAMAKNSAANQIVDELKVA